MCMRVGLSYPDITPFWRSCRIDEAESGLTLYSVTSNERGLKESQAPQMLSMLTTNDDKTALPVPHNAHEVMRAFSRLAAVLLNSMRVGTSHRVPVRNGHGRTYCMTV